jgi:Sulfotransferase family
MLILANAVFLHVPKTGGTWVREALHASGAAFDEYFVDGDQHADLSYCPCPDKLKFAFVRHPCGVYASYWRFKMAEGWDLRNPFDAECAATSFPDFVQGVLNKQPGWCSRMFEDYVGPPDRQIEFIGRFERLPDDLVHALRLAGEAFDERALRETPHANVSSWPPRDARWSRSLAEAVRRAERDAFDRFGYSLVTLDLE